MTDHIARVREQAEREANENIGGHIAQAWFIEGAAWLASRLTREKIADAIAGGTISIPGGYGSLELDDAENIADAVLALLVEGEA